MTHPLFRCHGIEAATAAERIAGPFSGPLRLLGLDGFFESSAIVTFPTEQAHVSMRTMRMCMEQVGD